MRILLDDGLQLGVGTGIGSYAQYLGDALTRLPDTAVTREDFAAAGSRRHARLAYLKYINSSPYQRKVAEFDVVHYANYAMPRKLPHGVLAAVTVHDLAAFSHPETLPPLYALYNRLMVRRAMKRADVIFAVSNTVKDEIAARFPHAAARTVALYPGHYDRAVTGESPALYQNEALAGLEKKKFFLFVGTLEKRKNLAELIRAYLLLLATYPAAAGYSLVLAGRAGYGARELYDLAKAAPVSADIRFTGYVSDSDRSKLYREAAAFVFPSLYEGFGSPQTECMACDLPLILSDIPTNREISGAWGNYFPLGDEGALAAVMKRVITEKKPHDSGAARERLARFRWQDTAARMREIYKTLLTEKAKKEKCK